MGKVRRLLSVLGVGGGAAAATLGGASWYYARRITEPPALVDATLPDATDRVTLHEVRRNEVVLRGPGADKPGVWGVALLRGYAVVADPTSVVALNVPSSRDADGDTEPGDRAPSQRRPRRRAQRDARGRTPWVGRRADAGGGRPGPDDDSPLAPRALPEEAVGAVEATRPLLLRHGTLDEGARGTLDGYAAPPHPEALGLQWREVTYDSPLGAMPAWRFEPTGTPDGTWAIFVHGRSARRHEAFRVLPRFAAAGIVSLAITYRNDADGIMSPDGHSHLGMTEWQDVEAAVAHALTNGARRVVLVGFSMGGACVMQFLRRSALAGVVPAIILDAPVLDWGAVIRQAALQRGLPAPVLPVLLPTSMGVARMRVGIDFAQLRHTGDASAFDRPTLLIHGDADSTVPVELSDAIAAACGDHVTYLRVPGAEHVKSWNTDRAAVEAAITDFLTTTLHPTPAP